jgi:hypothetical protein
MERMSGGMKLDLSLSAKIFLRKCEGLLPGKMTRFEE